MTPGKLAGMKAVSNNRGTIAAAAADLNGSGVGITDFLELLANWGPCP